MSWGFNQSAVAEETTEKYDISYDVDISHFVDNVFLGRPLPFDADSGQLYLINGTCNRLSRYLQHPELSKRVLNFYSQSKKLGITDFAQAVYQELDPEDQHQLFNHMLHKRQFEINGNQLQHEDYDSLVDPYSNLTLLEALEKDKEQLTKDPTRINRCMENCYQF